MGDNGFGVGSVVSFALGVALDNACFVTFGSDVALAVGSASVVSLCVAVGGPVVSLFGSAAPDAGRAVFFSTGLGVAGSDLFEVRGLLLGPSSAAVSVGVLVVDARASLGTEPSPRFVVPCSSLGSAVFASVPEAALESVDAAVPPDSSAHARPLLHPVTMAAPTAKATAKPPTRRAYALPGIRYV
jgi:hypothetical protein